MIPAWMTLGPEPWPASAVMAQALYHPEQGYYRQIEGPWGLEGKDYYTALDVGPLLGMALAARLEAVWRELDRPTRFQVVEPGAGRGWLGRDLLTAARGDFAEALHYVHRDDNPSARRAAETALHPWIDRGLAHFSGESEPMEPFVGAIVSNEWLDALPAQPMRWDGARWLGACLMASGETWNEGAAPEDAVAWFQAQSGGLEPGDGAPWVPALPTALAWIATLERGLFLAIDYGDSTDRLLAKSASLRRYQGHQVDGHWWMDLGRADLTADVDFTRVARLLEDQGLTPAAPRSLSAWIRNHAPLADWEAAWMTLEARERLARMENLLQLTLPNLMGERFKVLEARR